MYPYHAFVIPPLPVRKGEKENLWRDVRVTYNSVVWARQFLFEVLPLIISGHSVFSFKLKLRGTSFCFRDKL